MAKKLVPVETKEIRKILRQNLRIIATSSPLSVSIYTEKLTAENGICFDDFGEFLAALKTAVAEINARNPDIKVDLSPSPGDDMNLPLIFTFTLHTDINIPPPE